MRGQTKSKERGNVREMHSYRTRTDFSSYIYKNTGNAGVKLMRVRVSNVAVEKQQAINIRVTVFLHYLTGMESACAI